MHLIDLKKKKPSFEKSRSATRSDRISGKDRRGIPATEDVGETGSDW